MKRAGIYTAREFKALGEALYGPNWRARMAQRLYKTKRTIERYADGSRSIPVDVVERLKSLADDQILALTALKPDAAGAPHGVGLVGETRPDRPRTASRAT